MSNTLLYLVHGAETYFAEARYSLLTAFAHTPPSRGAIRYVVYTDRPEAFADLDVTTIYLDDTIKRAWLAGDDYVHRIKMCVHRDALDRFGGKVAFIDTDTYFRKNPLILFGRIGPGRSVLHVAEGRLSEIDSSDFTRLRNVVTRHRLVDPEGRSVAVAPNEMMWNSGVTGIDATDGWLLDVAISMVDQLRRIPEARTINQIEQFVTGVQLSHRTTVMEALDVVFHYWFHDVKARFRQRLPQLLSNDGQEDLETWGRRMLLERPSTSPLRRVKMRIRTLLRRLGMGVPGLRTST